MHKNILKYLFLLPFLLMALSEACSQVSLHSYVDIGRTRVSEGVYIKNAYRGKYRYDRYGLEGGIQFDLHSNNPHALTGFDVTGSGDFSIREFPFEVKAYLMLNRFSDLAYETDWGIRVETKRFAHFLFGLGTNFKTYAINSSARAEYDIDRTDSKLRENFNLIYILTVYARPHQNHWNIGLSCTNTDYYVINQSTNPVFNLNFKYRLQSGFTLYLESWLKQAGMLNIYAEHFGFFFRTGVVWEI